MRRIEACKSVNPRLEKRMADLLLRRSGGLALVSAILCAVTSGAAIASPPPVQVTQAVTPANAASTAKPLAAAPLLQTGSSNLSAQISAPQQICRTQTTLGSRLGKRRVCRTAAEWEVISRDAQQAIDARQRMNSGGRSKDGG